MFRVYKLTKAGEKEALFPNAEVISFSRKIGGGHAVLSMPKTAPETTQDNIQKWGKILIEMYNGTEYRSVYQGVIMSSQDTGTAFEIGLDPLQKLLSKRYTDQDETISGQAGQEAFDLLDSANTENDTGIDTGTRDVTTTVSVEEDESDLEKALDDLADASGAEWDIDPDGKLNFLQRLGKDNTGFVLRHKKSSQATNQFRLGRLSGEAERMANRIIAYSTDAGGTEIRSVVEDTDSIAKFGLLVERVRIDSAKDSTTLQNMAQALLDQKKDEISDVILIPVPKKTVENQIGSSVTVGYDFFDFGIGDDVTLELETDTHSITESKRILAINFRRGQNGNEISLILSRLGAKRSALDTIKDEEEKKELFQRIRNLESLI